MKVLFCGRPAYGHLYPIVPLAMAFQAQGHEVTFATGPEFVPRLEALGFRAHPVGRSILWGEEEAIRQNPSLGSLPPQEKPKLGAAMFSQMLPPRTAEDLLPLLAEAKPGLVVYEGADFGAPLAAALSDIPAVFHSYGAPWPQIMIDLMAPSLHELWRSYGIANPPADPIHGDVYLDISPPSLGDASHLGFSNRLPLRPVAFAEPIGELPGWVKEERDRLLVYVTLGTVVFERVDVIRAAVDGLAQLDADVLVSLGPGGNLDALGPLPPRVHAQLFVPQDKLLPFVDAIVHHCGSGTMLGGLSNGTPQLAIPQGADQFYNAGALASAGAGIALMPHEITPDAVAAGVKRLLDEPSFTQAARRIQSEIEAMPSPDEVARRLAGAV
jgi:UDP:flavonoid glycosyltransferase YjiC (YdhE family)